MDRYQNNAVFDNGNNRGMRGSGMYKNPEKETAGEQNYMNNLAVNMREAMGSNPFENIMPPTDQNMNYYQEYCRLFIANVVLNNQMRELIAEKNELVAKLSELEKNGGRVKKEHSPPTVESDKKSRIRRKASEIEKHFQCPIDTCQKLYGSEGSLIQHVKLKHKDFTEDPSWKIKLQKSEGQDSTTGE